MIRSTFKLLILSLIILSSCTGETLKPPNILWLTSEDNNIEWVRCYGNKYADTPNLDAFAESGFRYTHCYANAPVCAPSRSTWITGIYAISNGTHPMRSRNEIPHDVIKYYPDLLRAAGYYVSNGAKTDYNIGGRPDKDCWDDMDQRGDGKSITNWDALKENQPFFKIINFFESHESRAQGDVENTIHNPDSTDLRDYHPDLPDVRKNYAKYHDAVKRMDTNVGDALAMLEDLGLAENTIVIYNSDHGGVLPRSKRYLHATGIHAPLIIRIPEKYKSLYPADAPGSTVDRIVSFIDMPTTFLSLCQVEIPDYMQGKIFLGNEQDNERDYHFSFRGRMDERAENARAVYNKEFVYIRNYMPWIPWMQHLNYLWKMKATGAWEDYAMNNPGDIDRTKYFYPKLYTEEFYSLDEDWDNTNNLINDPMYADKIEDMRKSLREWQLEIHDAALIPESEMVKRAKDNKMTIYEMVRDPKLYNLPGLLDAADIALEADPDNLDKLRIMLTNNDPGIRYWAITGCFLFNDKLGAMKVLNDASHEVRAMAAWILIRTGEVEKGKKVLEELLLDHSYATLKVLNMIDWMGDEGESLMETVRTLELSPGSQNYEIRMQETLMEKWGLKG